MELYVSDFTGFGPMVIPDNFLVANQKNIIDETFRRVSLVIKTYKGDQVETPSEYHPNHVISIVGGRGTGKTSLLITALKRIKNDIEDALTLDIIRPDSMDRSLGKSQTAFESI